MALTSLIGRQYINDFVDPVSLGYEASKNMDDKQLVKLFNNIDFSSEKNLLFYIKLDLMCHMQKEQLN